MGYCIVGKEKECSEVRKKVLKANNNKLPKKYKETTVESCRFCPSFMEN